MKELAHLSQLAIDIRLQKEAIWKKIHEVTQKYLKEYGEPDRHITRGVQSNPVSGMISKLEFLACILQPVSSERKSQFYGLKILLIEFVICSDISDSVVDSVAHEIRKGRELTPPFRYEIFKMLPSASCPDYTVKLAHTLQEIAKTQKLHKTKKDFIRAIGYLIGLRFFEIRNRKTKLAPAQEIVRIKKQKKTIQQLSTVSLRADDAGKLEGLYEVIEPRTEVNANNEEPAETGILFQQMVNQEDLNFDVALNQQRRRSAYWLEQATLMSPYNSGLLIQPECERISSFLAEKLESGSKVEVFCAGLISLNYFTSLGFKVLLRNFSDNRFSPKGVYIRKIPPVPSCYKPSGRDVGKWREPYSHLELKLPSELKNWMSEYVNARGMVSPPASIGTEIEVLERCRNILTEVRDHGRYRLTESMVENAAKRFLTVSTVGALAAYLITGAEIERPPIISYYANVNIQLLQDSYREVLKKLWI
ncbi:hypothetical protein A9Q88_12880 [Gammaproteobacteria bacterium 50_400_T64]|nr:hypothetical protein A9Q88_12880 [Gammaproteobacteria bacterium 50_400_T64]